MSAKVKIDLTATPVYERHPRVFDAWDELEPGESMQIRNDHDPKALRHQFEGDHKDKYGWEYVSGGPGEWIINITKLKLPEATGEELRKKVQTALDAVRPYLQADGGDVELIDIDDETRVVKVRLKGACGGCPSAAMTLKSGVEATVKRYAPEIKRVDAA